MDFMSRGKVQVRIHSIVAVGKKIRQIRFVGGGGGRRKEHKARNTGGRN